MIRRLAAPATALLIAAGGPAVADPRLQGANPAPLTAKERLGSKADDEQGVNNCKVPVEKRGPKPRPGCPGDRRESDHAPR